MLPRIATSVIGAWLALSSCLWPRTPSHGFNVLFVGLLLMLSGFCGIWMRGLRFQDAGLAGWLLVSKLLMDHDSTFNVAHDMIFAFIVLVLAGIAGRDAPWRHDHWVAEFDKNPRLMTQSISEQLAG